MPCSKAISGSLMSERAARRAEFVRGAGWADAVESLLAGDASFRTYYRLTRPGGTAVVMDAPPPQEDVRPFVRIARHLLALGLSPPEILAEDAERGFLLIEDLGDDTFARVLSQGGDELALYSRAADALAALHNTDKHALLPGLTAYAGDALIEAAMLLPEWYLPAATGRPASSEAIEGYRSAWQASLARMPPHAETLVLRDFHKDNLIWLPDRAGVRACGLLDFQDAQRGHAAYDLVSLIEDARRDVAPAVYSAVLDRYLVQAGVRDRQGFDTAFRLLGAQRHARVIGLFVRLLQRDGKPDYLPHLPRAWRLFDRALGHPALAPLRGWVDRHLPPSRRQVGV